MKKLELTDSFLEKYKNIEPNWGYGELGKFVVKRSYGKNIEDEGRHEEWWETVQRVVEGIYGAQIDHCNKNGLPFNMNKGQVSAQHMYDLIFNFKFLPPGRGLEHMGTPALEAKGSGILYNCSAVSTMDICHDSSRPFTYMMDFSALGVGVGFDVKGSGTIVRGCSSRSKDVFVIPDSREGWVESLGILIDSHFKGRSLPSFDYSMIRPAGSKLNTMNGTASGPGPLKDMHEAIDAILEAHRGKGITVTGIVDIMNHVGKCIVSGGTRRSSQIVLGPIEDEFMNLKNPATSSEEMKSHRWAANHSIYADVGMDYSSVSEATAQNGEPGYNWLENSVNRGRLKDGYVYDNATLMNPCQPAHATVLTPNGISTIGKIVEGDVIWSGSKWTKVLRKWSTGVKQVNEYHTTAGVFVGTENHRVVSNGEKIEAGAAESIDTCVGENHAYLRDVQSVMDGLVIGDGSVDAASGNLVGLYIGEEDQDYFDSHISELIIKHRPGINRGFHEVVTTVKHWELPKTYDRSIPDRFFYGNSFKKSSFLRGLYSANGSVAGNRITLKASSFKIINQVQQMLSSLGIRSYYTTNKPTIVEFTNGSYTCKESYDLNITTDRDLFVKSIGFLQEYKLEKLKLVKKNSSKITYDIIKTIPVGEEEVFDITVAAEEHTYWTGGLLVSNCSEINLQSQELCNLVTIYPANHSSLDDINNTLKYAYLYSKSVTLIPTHDKTVNAIIGANRRIGASISGVTQSINKFGYRNFMSVLDKSYTYLRSLDEKYSNWLCIPKSIKITSVKPDGSTSLPAGATPGVHFPHSEFYIRRVRVQVGSPLIKACREAGYKVEKSVYGDNTFCIEFPVKEENFSKSKYDVTIWEQLNLVADMQKYWSDNAVSATITFTKEEAKSLKTALEMYEDKLKSISFLPLDEHSYEQAPYETITKEKYEKMAAKIKPIDFSSSKKETSDKFCDSSSCTI